jgi:hypothetical protein
MSIAASLSVLGLDSYLSILYVSKGSCSLGDNLDQPATVVANMFMTRRSHGGRGLQ